MVFCPVMFFLMLAVLSIGKASEGDRDPTRGPAHDGRIAGDLAVCVTRMRHARSTAPTYSSTYRAADCRTLGRS